MVKNLPANAGDARDVGLIPVLGRFPGVGSDNTLCTFAWRIPCAEGNPMCTGKEQQKLTELCARLGISLLHSDLKTLLPSS